MAIVPVIMVLGDVIGLVVLGLGDAMSMVVVDLESV